MKPRDVFFLSHKYICNVQISSCKSIFNQEIINHKIDKRTRFYVSHCLSLELLAIFDIPAVFCYISNQRSLK